MFMLFLLVYLIDQESMPTLVECKRRNDARKPRETVGQMLEYAANGRHYWTGSELQIHAFGARQNLPISAHQK